MKYRNLASTVLLAVSLSSSAAFAVPTADTSPTELPKIPYASLTSGRALRVWFDDALGLLREAQALEKEGKLAEALEKYRDALRIEPYTNTYAEVGLAEARAGNLLACARNLQTAIQPWTPHYPMVRPIELLREVYTYCKKDLGNIAIKINVPDVRVTIDGEDIREWPYFAEIHVEPGKHTIKAKKDSYWVNQTEVEVGPGERKPLSIAMQPKYETHFIGFSRPVNFTVNASLSTAGAKDDQPTWPRNLMIASSVGLAVGLGGLVTGLVMRDDTSSAWTGVAVGGGILGALSIGGLGIGIASRPSPPPPNVIITPQIAKDGGGVQLAGTLE
ncbi:hypothetical protein [Polyangium mundeleinium]|uniref:PEGA domain-containing protein n=1 Tax=Polyangium mundeleinium TaxID=2995306 RepID=A0ABT5EX77_9BACT|nr:hypothetical protein [Polyangium mundeleinium]MDC0746421.1 hypothetical protein [Polyangium mundeleinium]